MNFRADLAAKVMVGRKTVTRRRMSDNPRSPWYRHACSMIHGRSYAVCPGRGKAAIGRVLVTDVRAATLGDVDDHEAHLEGFPRRASFVAAWTEINGDFDPHELVWRVVFQTIPAPPSPAAVGER